jgi:hypothetical protein
LKREPSTAARSLRAASLVITVVSLVAFSTIAYSFYEDVTGVVGALGSGSQTPSITSSTVVQGTSATIYVNATIPNRGLYPLAVGLTCLPSNGSVTVTCADATVTVPPGQEQTLHFAMNLQNLNPSGPNNISVAANVTLAIEPFVTFVISTRFVSGGGQAG